MPKSVIANFDKTFTNEEEEDETGVGNLPYIARTIPTNTPFFKASRSTEKGHPTGTSYASERGASSSVLAASSVRNLKELPSAAAENPGEFDNEFEEDPDHEYQDASEYQTPGGPGGKIGALDSHGPDHYGCLEARPITDNQDYLWTEIDALDDVKRLAKDVNLYEGFPPNFEQELTKIRASHAHLLKAMRDRNARIEEGRRHEITTKSDSHSNSNDVLNRHTTGNISRIISEPTTSGPSSTTPGAIGNRTAARIDQDYMGATVKADEDKYVQEMIENIKSIRI